MNDADRHGLAQAETAISIRFARIEKAHRITRWVIYIFAVIWLLGVLNGCATVAEFRAMKRGEYSPQRASSRTGAETAETVNTGAGGAVELAAAAPPGGFTVSISGAPCSVPCQIDPRLPPQVLAAGECCTLTPSYLITTTPIGWVATDGSELAGPAPFIPGF